jgi:sugar phosphate isomerase/epimerase
MKLGISTYALTWSIGVPGYETPECPLNAMDIIQITKKAGFHLVQYADNLPLHLLTGVEIEELRKFASDCLIDIEVGMRGTETEKLLKYLDICKKLKSPILRTLITTQDLNQAKSELLAVLPEFEAAGVTIAIENHGLHSTKQLVSLFQTLNSEYVKCCLDTVNSFGALEGSEAVIQALALYTVNLHIKDFNICRVDHQMGFEILGTPAGQGKLDLSSIFDLLAKNKLQPTAVLELWTPFNKTVEETIKLENEWLEESIDFLHSFNFK